MKEARKEKKKPKPMKNKPAKKKDSGRSRSKDEDPKPREQPTPEYGSCAEIVDEMHTNDDRVVSDLPKQYHPIRVFVDDRAVLLEQLFETVRGSDLQAIIPETLKSFRSSELKKICMKQLETMPKELILHILSGKDPGTYTTEIEHDTVTSTEQELSETKSEKSLKRKSDDIIEDLVSSTTGNLFALKKKIDSDIGNQDGSDAQGLDPSSTDTDLPEIKFQEVAPLVENIQQPVGELFELEMRARAIRSFLKAKGFSSSDEDEDEAKKLEPGKQ